MIRVDLMNIVTLVLLSSSAFSANQEIPKLLNYFSDKAKTMTTIDCDDFNNGRGRCYFTSVEVSKIVNNFKRKIEPDEKVVDHCVIHTYKTSQEFTKVREGLYKSSSEVFSCKVFSNIEIENLEQIKGKGELQDNVPNYKITKWTSTNEKKWSDPFCKDMPTTFNFDVKETLYSLLTPDKFDGSTLSGLNLKCNTVSFSIL